MSASIPLLAADFETSLATSVAEGATTATLQSATDADGVVLASGLYAFTVDNDTSYKEYIVCSLVGTALTNITSISRQGVATTGFANYHRRGASVQITDWAVLYRVIANLTGVINLDSGTPLSYDAAPALGSSNQLATVQYVLDHINGGAVSFNAETIAGMAGETLTTGQWVYLKESDGRWYKTDATSAAKVRGVRVGKALGAGTAGNAISGGVFINGLETTGTYAAFTTYYFSDTPGALSTSAGTISVVAGISDGNSKLIVGQTPGSYRDALAGSLGTPTGANRYITQLNTFSDQDQSQTTQNNNVAVGEANATTRQNKIAQSFIPTTSKIRGVRLYKTANTGTFTGTVSIALQADSAGAPSGSDLATITLTNAYYLALQVGEFQATFSTEYDSLTIGSLYWIVITTSTSDTTNHPNLGGNSAGGYANGSVKYNNTTDGWTTLATTDLYFKTLSGAITQVPITTSDGTISPINVKGLLVAVPLTAGTSVTGTGTETSSYSTTIDTTNLFTPLKGIRLRITGTTTFASGTSNTTTFKAKIGGIVVGTATISATNATSPTGTFYMEITLYSDSTGKLASQLFVIQPTVSNITSSGSQIGNSALSAQFIPSTSSTLDLTVTLSTNNTAGSGQVQDVLVERI